MRIEPNIPSAEELLLKKQRRDKVTRIVAIVLAGVSVFVFFLKLLFF